MPAGPLIKVAGGNPADEFIDGKYVKPGSLIPDYEALKATALTARYDEEREWVLAWSYFKGRHWVTWRDDRLQEIEKQDLPKMVLNFIQSIVLTRLGHLVKNRPMWVCVPQTSDEEARNATKLGLKVLEAYHRKLRMGEKVLRAILWMLVPGISYLKLGWDPTLGGSWEQRLTAGGTLGGALGDVFCDLCKPHEILVEPGADDIEGTQRLIHQTYQPIGQVLKRWPHLKGKIEPIDMGSREGQIALQNWYGPEMRVAGGKTNRVEVAELHYRTGTPRPDASFTSEETGLFEQGLRAVIVNGKEVAEAKPVDPGMPELPFVKFSEVLTDGFYSTSTARQLLHVNKILDVEMSQNEYNRKVLRPKTLVPYQAHIKPGAWDQSDDEVVEYYHPYRPEAYSPPALPAHHQALPANLVTLIKELSGNTDILAGKAPPETRSGRMVSYLQEYAGTVLGVAALNVEYAYEVAGNILLQIIRERVREERLVPMIGRGRQTEIVSFKGDSLRPIASIAVQTGSALPISRVEKQDRIEKWMEKGWLPPEKGLLMLDVADPDSDLFRDDEQDRENADEVVQKLRAVTADALMKAQLVARTTWAQSPAASMPPMPGAPPPGPSERDTLRALGIEAFEFDNHDIILDEVNKKYRKTGEYRRKPKALRAIADAYCDWQLLFKLGINPDNPFTGVAARVPGPLMPGVTVPDPAALPGGPMPPGMPGGVGGPSGPVPAESGQEGAEALPPVRRPRGPGRTNR